MTNPLEPATSDIERWLEAWQQGHDTAHAYTTLLGLTGDFDTSHVVAVVSAGLPFDAFTHLGANLALPTRALSELVQIPERTLRRRKERGRLEPDESDRLLRLARIVGLALELFEGDADEARHWLTSPRPALGGATPLEFARTDPGAREVEDLIGRLEHGIAS